MTPIPTDPRTDASTEPGPAPEPSARPAAKPPRRRYKIRGPETWALIRESYLAGAAARELAARYDVTEWAIWRRAWKENWTKQDRVEPRPSPALEPLTPREPAGASGAAAPEPADLMRTVLSGLDEALRQSRLTEARNLAQIAGALEKLGDGSAARGGGGFTLEDMARVIFDPEYRTEVMDMSRDSVRDPVKASYWARKREDEDARGEGYAEIMNRGFRLGREAARQAMGLEPDPDAPDEYVWYANTLVRRAVLEAKRSPPPEADPWA